MLTRAGVARADTVLVPGASGGVGGALVQLAKRRGARVIALASEAKHADAAALGPDRLLPRAPEDLRARWKAKGSPWWPMWWAARPGPGSSTSSNAAGATPVRAPSPGRWWTLDLRTFYLRDLTFTGSTVIDLEVMPNLVRYIEAGDPAALAATYPLEELRRRRRPGGLHRKEGWQTGNIVVVPMKITRITVYQVDLPLEHPYWLSGGRLKFEVLDATLVKARHR
jgi:NADPH:quinone reductase-like Zn-dependent oxidoreductase